MQERKKIVVVGANGSISRQIIPLLLKDYEVHCLVRSPPSFAINSIFLRFIDGDALSGETWDECLEGKHAVVSCFGTRQGEAENKHLEFTNLVIQKMKQKGVKRFIGFFSHGAMQNQEGKNVCNSQGFQNKEKGLCHSECVQALTQSELDFTAICLWKFQAGNKEVEAQQNTWSQSPADSEGVAAFLKQQLNTPNHLGKTVFLHNKP